MTDRERQDATQGKPAADAMGPGAGNDGLRAQYALDPQHDDGRSLHDGVPPHRDGDGARQPPGHDHPRSFDEVERDVEAAYLARKAREGYTWNEARKPARAAWRRVRRSRTT